jgi:predicted nucleic acid-binding protein
VRLADSSGWVQHLMDGPLADAYAEHLAADDLLVPTVVLYEVCKFMQREVSADAAASVASRMKEAHVVPLDEQLALEAAELSLQHRLAMADADFRDLPYVEYLAPKSL